MKKIISIIIISSMLMVFFCSSVYGADYSTIGVQNNYTTHDGITMGLRVVQLYADGSGVPYADGSVAVPYLMTVRLYNETSSDICINDVKVAPNWSSTGPIRYLSQVDNISSDLFFGVPNTQSAGWIDILPSTTFSYANGIVIPAHRTMYCVGVIYIHAQYILDSNSGQYIIDKPTLSGDPYIRFTKLNTDGVSFFDPASSEDLSVIETALDDYIGDPSSATVLDRLSSISNIDDAIYARMNNIITAINSVVTALGWSGTTPSYSPWSYYSTSGSYASSITRLSASATITASRSFTSNTDFEKLTNTSGYFTYNSIIPVQLYVVIDNDTGSSVAVTGTPYITGLANKTNGYSVVPGDVQSNAMTAVRISSNYSDFTATFDFADGTMTIPEGRSVMVLNYYIIYTDTVWTEWRTNNITINLPGISVIGDRIDDMADDIVSSSNTIHNQEQIWYTQNQSTLQSVGLSNYTWGTSGNTGIVGVSNDFTDLWNAMGGWTSVYIFSMTLTVALTIIRYHVKGGKHKKES